MSKFFSKTDIEDIYPLSPIQNGILFESNSSPTDDPYRQQFVWILEGDLNPELLRNAWNRLIHRHSIFRTSFHSEGLKVPAQVVIRANRCPQPAWLEMDFSRLDDQQRHAELEKLKASEHSAPLDFTMPPLMRIALAKLGNQRWALIWSLHHLIIDGWSGAVATAELAKIYDALKQGHSSHLPAAASFRSYINHLAQRNADEARQFWTEILHDLSVPTLPLLASPIKEGEVKDGIGEFIISFDNGMVTGVKKQAKELQVTENSICQAALSLLLARYCRSDDVTYGTIQADRPIELSNASSIVGPLITCLPCRQTVEAEQTRSDHIRKTHHLIAQSLDHASLSLNELLALTSLPASSALFSVLYAFENYAPNASSEEPRDFTVVDQSLSDATNFPITMVVYPHDIWSVRILYDRASFSSDAIKAFVEQYCLAIKQLSQAPDCPLGSTSLFDHERYDAKHLWRLESNKQDETEVDAGDQASPSFLELWREQVSQGPQRLCAQDAKQSLTYAQMDLKARSFAAFLNRQKAKEMRVGIHLDQGCDALIGILGSMLAGWAWSPLSTSLPAKRLHFLATEAALDVILTDKAEFWSQDRHALLSSDDLHALPAETGPLPEPDCQRSAYILFTSGTSGMPKGVEVSYDNVRHFLDLVKSHIQPKPEAKVLQFASFTFDMFMIELGCALVSRGSLHFPDGLQRAPGPDLEAFILEHGITTLCMAPAVLSRLRPEHLPLIDLLAIGGEACPPDLPVLWLEDKKGRRFLNLYGPTEATVFVTHNCFDDARPCYSLGQPNKNTRLYLLDHHGNFAPPHMPGELIVAGACVAKGYLNNPQQTETAFPMASKTLPSDHLESETTRLYMTGDMACWDSNGDIIYLGRQDAQIKLNGVRIELQEITSFVHLHADVQTAVTLVYENQLALFVVPKLDCTSPATLQQNLLDHIIASLPGHLVPKWLQIMEGIPLAPSGKADQKALIALLNETGSEIVAPSDAMESSLHQIWKTIFTDSQFGVTDNFFALGGTSIDALRLCAEAQKQGIVFDVASLMRSPTIHLLAKMQTISGGEASEAALPKVRRKAAHDSLVSSAQAHSLNFHSRSNETDIVINGITALHLQGNLDAKSAKIAFVSAMECFPDLAAGFSKDRDGWSRHLVSAFDWEQAITHDDFSMHDLPLRQDYCNRRLQDSLLRKFDPNSPPLIRLHIIKLGSNSHVLALVAGDYILDAHSRQEVLMETGRNYLALKDGLSLADETHRIRSVRFGDFVAWREALGKDDHEKMDIDAWDNWLEPDISALDLYTKPNVSNKNRELGLSRSIRHFVAFEEGSIDRLIRLSADTGYSKFNLMLSLLVLVARERVGEDKAMISIPVNHRIMTELLNIVGPMVEFLPIVLPLDCSLSIFDILQSLQKQCECAIHKHSLVPIEALAKKYAPQTLDGPMPFSATGFTFVESNPPNIKLPDIDATVWPVLKRPSLFSLYFGIQQSQRDLSMAIDYDPTRMETAEVQAIGEAFVEQFEALMATSTRTALNGSIAS